MHHMPCASVHCVSACGLVRPVCRGACGAACAGVAAGCVVGGPVEVDCVSDASLLSPNLRAFTPTFPTHTLDSHRVIPRGVSAKRDHAARASRVRACHATARSSLTADASGRLSPRQLSGAHAELPPATP